jgi:hypothetical protein
VASGFEIGLAIEYPATSIERDYAYVAHHPLAEAYALYNTMPYDRPTWDLTPLRPRRTWTPTGRWWTRSLNTDTHHYITYSGTAYPLLALALCHALPTR